MNTPADHHIVPIGPDTCYQELTDLLHSAYAELARLGFRYMATHQDAATTKRRCEKGETWLAIAHGRTIGTITLNHRHTTQGTPYYDRADVAAFGQFAVHPAHRRKGIGRALLDHVESRATQLGCGELGCDTAEGAVHLIQMYQARGYRFIEYADWHETNYRSVILGKSLGCPAE